MNYILTQEELDALQKRPHINEDFVQKCADALCETFIKAVKDCNWRPDNSISSPVAYIGKRHGLDLVQVPEAPKHTHFCVPRTQATLDALLNYHLDEDIAKKSLGKIFPIKELDVNGVLSTENKYWYPLSAVELQ